METQIETDKKRIEIINSYSGKIVGTVPNQGPEDVERAITKASKGAKISAGLSINERIQILRKVAQTVENQSEKLAILIASEGVKTIREARKEVARCVNTLTISAEEARRINGETIPFDSAEGSENRLGYYYKFPVGVITAITPFNDPLNLVAHKLGPAVAAGNSIILKPSSYTPLSAIALADIFSQAGLPEGIINVITGEPEDLGDALITDERIRMISFTGGVKSARQIIKKAGLKKIAMELGSSSPVIVMDDADLRKAVELSVSGAFWAAGQNCVGTKRIYIHQDVYAEFEKNFVAQTMQLKYGDQMDESTDLGPIVSEIEAIKVKSWVDNAVESGAKLLTPCQRIGSVITPTVLAELPQSFMNSCGEVFGPVVTLHKITSLEEAIEKSNNSEFGLHAGIFTQKMENAFTAIKKLEVGGVIVNDSSDYRIDLMPFGGVKSSGLGREGIRSAISEMTETKVVCFNL